MSFLKRLFGGGRSAMSSEPEIAAEQEYSGYRLIAAPQKEERQFRLAGRIERDREGQTQVHQLIRADLFTSVDDANEAFFRKARQVIDEQGDRIFQ
jgi:hypothetical protein